ncbi:NifU family protein [Actinomyces sp. 2119]|uniref:NifU family protein n=1 Tax=Actinomyces sp. 2119 TaxID=2321393 RepID=UPI000E6CFE6F|nr:NifU family protein [Actinomyces sp. 2119]RJF41171.1 NifU family protein [Actinomyces sp. 2119]
MPTHPVSTPDPSVLRWVVPHGLLPFSGQVSEVPAPLQRLLDDGTLTAVHVVPGGVVTMLGAERSWDEEGGSVRSALVAALDSPGGWIPAAGARALGRDDVLEAAAQEVAEETVNDLARSHGGSFTVRVVRDGVVEVDLQGACHDCPAAVMTMHVRFERMLRRRCPWLVEVRQGS